MTRTAQLIKNPKHKQVEDVEFMLRFRFLKPDQLPTKIDGAYLFKQYIVLYVALEQRLQELIKNNENFICLDIFLKEPWTNRSQVLKDDLAEMEKSLSKDEKSAFINQDSLLLALETMVKEIKSADPVSLFAYFSVITLGDVFGGQALKGYIQRQFSEQILSNKFYNSITKQAGQLNNFVNNVKLSNQEEAIFSRVADNVLGHHIKLFEQMEVERAKFMTKKVIKERCAEYGRYAFFGTVSLLGAAAIGTMYLNNNTQPQ